MVFRIVSLWRSLEISQRLDDQKITTKNPDFQIGTLFALAITMPKSPKNIFFLSVKITLNHIEIMPHFDTVGIAVLH